MGTDVWLGLVAATALSIGQPRDGAVYPPEFPAPVWHWQGGHPPYQVSLAAAGVTETRTDQPRWQPPADVWRAVNQPNQAGTLTVRDAAGMTVTATFRTSADRVTGSLLYREVVLPFAEAVRDPARLAWRFGSVTATSPPPVVLTGLPVCGNCHSFSGDGRVLGLDVDYGNDKGSYALVPVAPAMTLARTNVITWNAYRPDDGRFTFGLLPRLSPDGRHVIASVKDRSVFVPMDDLAYSQRFFPIQGILAAYDRDRGTFAALPGADDPALVQANAAWSPDGAWVYFCRAPAVELTGLRYPKSALLTRAEADDFFRRHPGYGYGIWRVPWNGGRGGTAEPVRGAVVAGRSCYFPRLTPDGRFLIFCQARQHMLLQPDAELWIVPAAGGDARRLRCNEPGMNSWHTISPDGRWLVFASKADGPYTQLRLAHLDADGHASPAVPLQRLATPERAANIPEFANLAADAIGVIREEFLDAASHLRAGTDCHNARDPAGAERHFRAGLALAPDDSRLQFSLGTVLAGQQRLPDAIACFRAAARLDPTNAVPRAALARALLAHALLDGLPTAEAATEIQAALALARQTGNTSELAGLANLWALAAPAPAAPRLDGITIDGAPGDWGDRGLRVERLALHDGTGNAVTPAPAGSGTLRLGWDEQGLLLLLELPASRLAATGTVNLIVRDGAKPLNWWQATVDSPAPDAPRLIEHRHDQWVDPRDARPALAALAPLTLAARTATTNDTCTFEARLPWRNLGLTPREGLPVRLQVQVWKGGPSLAWFPFGWAEKCTAYAHALTLARAASPPLASPARGAPVAPSTNIWHHGGFSLYVPPGRASVRGVYVTLPGNKHRTPVDEAALDGYTPMVSVAGQRAFVEEVGFALLGANGPGTDAAPILDALRALAATTGHPELATVPLIADGYSMGSVRTLALLEACPERLLAFASMNFMKADFVAPAAARKVPGLLYTGPKDGYGKGYPAAFAANRAAGAPWALIVQPGVGHTVGDGPVLLYPFYRDIIRARLVETPAGTVTLRDLDPATGWLGDAQTFAVAPAAAAQTDPATASWLSSGYVARLWRWLNTQPAGRLTAADLLDCIEPRKQ